MATESIILETKRVCYACGSDETYIDGRNFEHWYQNRPLFQWLCEKCNNQLIKNPMHLNRGTFYVRFRDELVYLGFNPKIGVCNLCRAVVPFDCKRTHRHHVVYNEDAPLKDTLETCAKCHRREHKELRTK